MVGQRRTAAAPTAPPPPVAQLALLAEPPGMEIAQRHRATADRRIKKLVDWIREHICPDLAPLGAPVRTPPKTWTDRRVLIFTEYADTKDYVSRPSASSTSGPCPDRKPMATEKELLSFHKGWIGELTAEHVGLVVTAQALVRDADHAVAAVRRVGDLVVEVFFSETKEKERKKRLEDYANGLVLDVAKLPEPDLQLSRSTGRSSSRRCFRARTWGSM